MLWIDVTMSMYGTSSSSFETIRGKLSEEEIKANSKWKKKARIGNQPTIAENFSTSNPSIKLQHHPTQTGINSTSEGAQQTETNNPEIDFSEGAAQEDNIPIDLPQDKPIQIQNHTN